MADKKQWILYNSTDGMGGSCGQLQAANAQEVIEQFKDKAWGYPDGVVAQCKEDYSQLVKFYRDGTVKVWQ
jgi:hypothetical protein